MKTVYILIHDCPKFGASILGTHFTRELAELALKEELNSEGIDNEDPEEYHNYNIVESEVEGDPMPELLEACKVILEHIKQTNTDFIYNGMIIPKVDVEKYLTQAIKLATE